MEDVRTVHYQPPTPTGPEVTLEHGERQLADLRQRPGRRPPIISR